MIGVIQHMYAQDTAVYAQGAWQYRHTVFKFIENVWLRNQRWSFVIAPFVFHGQDVNTEGVSAEENVAQPRFFCMVTQVRVRAGQARPLTNTAASQTLARSDREIGGSKMGP